MVAHAAVCRVSLNGFGYFIGLSGDAVQMVSQHPETWKPYDVATDATAAVMSVTNIILAHRSPRVSASGCKAVKY